MLISTEWIKDYVNIPMLSPKELASKFTLCTAEVEEVITTNLHLKLIEVVEITQIEKHPEAEKLNLVTFKKGNGEHFRVVCGASNVALGLRVPFAPVGTSFPDGLTLTPKKIRGVVSEGMLCSKAELGLEKESEGLFELPADTKLGTTMDQFLKLSSDVLLNIDNKSLTHRPDLWGHLGMAREFATIFETNLNDPYGGDWTLKLENEIAKNKAQKSPLKVRFSEQSDHAGIAFFGLSVDGVSVGETPSWMAERLTKMGLRSINSLVDISNYVMLELGMPLHIYDRDLISGDELKIGALNAATDFVTLDGQRRSLLPSDTVISDQNEALVLAGIMGGEKSSVQAQTKNIFIEVANWKPAMVRKTSTRLGLRTDSSQRFEKTLDSKLCKRTLLRTLELILNLNPKAQTVGDIVYAGIDLEHIESITIATSASKISRVLGKEMSADRVGQILTRLGFSVAETATGLSVLVPSYRATKDVSCEADLIEEIGRVVGYDHIAPISPQNEIVPVKLSDFQLMNRKIKDFLIMSAKSFEVMTYPLVGEALLNKTWFHQQDQLLKLINSVSIDHSAMRPSMIPSLLQVAMTNAKNFHQFRVFELGRTYQQGKGQFASENEQLALMFYRDDETPFLELQSAVYDLLNSLNIPFEFDLFQSKFPNMALDKNYPGIHPYEQRSIKIMGKHMGAVISIHPILLSELKIKGHVSMFLLDLSVIKDLKLKEKTKYAPINKNQISTFDWTVVMPENGQMNEAVEAVLKGKIEHLTSVAVVDLFVREGVSALTLRATLQKAEGTLTSDELKSAELKIIEATNSKKYFIKK